MKIKLKNTSEIRLHHKKKFLETAMSIYTELGKITEKNECVENMRYGKYHKEAACN